MKPRSGSPRRRRKAAARGASAAAEAFQSWSLGDDALSGAASLEELAGVLMGKLKLLRRTSFLFTACRVPVCSYMLSSWCKVDEGC